ncbi:MAG: fibrinogen-like YCDxxxxGGGW domain-containing protein [Candidatus Absconditabacteria bacterium]
MSKQLQKLLKSFTLIELIIVIAIIAVLGATAFLLLTQWMSKGRDAQRISDLSTIKTALDIALSKNDELPLPDENNVLLYSGTEILNQGKFGESVVKSIGTLNKVPKDRVHGEYEYTLLYDKKNYRVRANMENKQYQLSYLSRVKASDEAYRFVGKDLKAVVVKEMFIYLPSMFITGYVGGEYDLYNSGFNVFVGEKSGEYKSGFALPITNIDAVKVKLGTLGLEEAEISQIIAQGTGQPQIVVEAKCNGTLPENAVLNGTVKSGESWTYSEIGGDCKFKCKELYSYEFGNCIIPSRVEGSEIDGYEFFENGIQVYPKSCNDLIESNAFDFKISGPWNGTKFQDGVYRIKPNTNPAFKVYCDMTKDLGGWTLCFSNANQKKGDTLEDGFDFMNTKWTSGNSNNYKFFSGDEVSGYGNFCNELSFGKVYSKVLTNLNTEIFSTSIMDINSNAFVSGKNSYSSGNNHIGIWHRSVLEPKYFAGLSCAETSNSYTHGTVLCISNGSKYQMISGNVNGNSSTYGKHGDRMCKLSTVCGISTNVVQLYVK